MKTNPLGLSTSAVIKQEQVGYIRERGGQGDYQNNQRGRGYQRSRQDYPRGNYITSHS